MRVVIDTNVLVSAALNSNSTARRALDLASGSHTLLSSCETLSEAREVFARPRFDRYLTFVKRMHLLRDYELSLEPVEITEKITACRDPRDDKFLSLALAGHADVLITGDIDLLNMHPFRGLPILTPTAFLAL